MRETRIYVLILLCLAALIGCSEEVEPPVAVDEIDGPGAPATVSLNIGDGLVQLNWTPGTSGNIGHYAVYFSDESPDPAEMIRQDTTSILTYTVTGLLNGRRYFFRVASVTPGGLEGEKSGAVTATPGIFSIAIENGAEYTDSRDVTVNITAPNGTDLMQLSEDSLFTGAFWKNFSQSTSFTLSDSDGSKKVFARFQFEGGNSASSVSDIIILDRFAGIDSVTESSGGALLNPGDILELRLYATDDETGGEANVEIAGLGSLELNDQGYGGDATAGDGVYSLDFTIPIGEPVVNAELTGNFIDAAGNAAPQVSAGTRVTISSTPAPVTLTATTISSSEIELSWTTASETGFSKYRIFRSTTLIVNEASELINTINSRTTTTYTDADLIDTTQYNYVVYVYDVTGQSAASNIAGDQTLENEEPTSVGPIGISTSGSDPTTVALTWTANSDDDFQAYHVLRDGSTYSTYDDDLIREIINSQSTTSYSEEIDDAGTYYYSVWVIDKQGALSTASVKAVVIP